VFGEARGELLSDRTIGRGDPDERVVDLERDRVRLDEAGFFLQSPVGAEVRGIQRFDLFGLVTVQELPGRKRMAGSLHVLVCEFGFDVEDFSDVLYDLANRAHTIKRRSKGGEHWVEKDRSIAGG